MFQIKPLSSLPRGSTLLIQGATFAYYGLPIRFEFTSEVVPKPVELYIIVTRDDTSPTSITMSDITVNGDSGSAFLRIVNPPVGNSTNIYKQQIAMLSEHRAWLGLNFLLAEFTNVSHFLFYYEFYEEELAAKEPSEPTQIVSTGARV